jgi:hypothetical protein
MIWLSLSFIVIFNLLLYFMAFSFNGLDGNLSDKFIKKCTIKENSFFRRVLRLKNHRDGSPILYIHVIPFFTFLVASILFIPFMFISFYTGFLPEKTIGVISLLFVSPVVVHLLFLGILHFFSFYSLR